MKMKKQLTADEIKNLFSKERVINTRHPEVETAKVGDYIQIRGGGDNQSFKFRSVRLNPTRELVNIIWGEMLPVEYDTIYFKIIVFHSGESLLYACYNQILGSRAIAKFDYSEFKKFLTS